MRLLHVHSGNLYGGVETTLVAQARYADLCPGIDLAFALCFAGRFSSELIDVGTSVLWLDPPHARNPFSVHRARRQLTNLLAQENFDAVATHSCWSQAIFGPAVRAAGIPLVFYLHATARGNHWLERWARRTTPQMIVCNSRFTAATVTNLYPQARAEIVYCPVAPPQLNYSESEIARLRTELRTPADACVIIQISRMEEGKGQALHLEALTFLKDLPGWFCWQVGNAQRPRDAQYLASLRNKAEQLNVSDRVRFVGEGMNVGELLAAADIYCQPNTRPDSFGITFVEALYAGLPVVTTAIGGATEVVDGSCGLLVDEIDAKAIARALRLLIEDTSLRRALGAAGPARARALTDISTQMSRLRDCFQSALNGNGKTSREGVHSS